MNGAADLASDLPDGWHRISLPGYWATNGPLLRTGCKADGWLYGLVATGAHANPLGVVHGGTIMALLDQVMVFAAWEAVERRPVVTVQLNTQFYAAARPGDLLIGDGRVGHRAGSMLFVSGTIRVGESAVAEASATFKVKTQ